MTDPCFDTVQERMRYMAQVAKTSVMRNSFTMGADRIDELERELAEARTDAERYRWMRLCAGNPAAMGKLETFDEPKNPEEFDAAIDAARKP